MKKLYFTFCALLASMAGFAQLTLGSVDNLILCDDNIDGYATFNLAEANNDVLDNYLPDYYSVGYFETEDAALAGSPMLPFVYTNVVAGEQLIYAKVWETTNPANYGITTFSLIVNAYPAATATPITYAICNDMLPNDGTAPFDLTALIPELVAGDAANYNVDFYTSQADLANSYLIQTPEAFVNTANPQTIYALVADNTTQCAATVLITLQVMPLPEAFITAPNHYFCEDFSGMAQSAVVLTVNTAPANTVTWYRNGLDVTVNNTAHQFYATMPGTYTAVVTSGGASGCISNTSNAFEVFRSGPAAILGDTGYTYDGANLTISIVGYGTYEYALNIEGPWQESNVFTNVAPGEYMVYVKDLNGCDTAVIVIDAALGLENAQANDFKIYPNPVTDEFTVSALAELKTVEVYNTLGQQVITQNALGTTATVNMQALQSGIYMVKVSAYTGAQAIKVIKQ